MQKKIDITKRPTAAQMAALARAAEMPMPEDSEYPEFTEKELFQFTQINVTCKPRNKRSL